MRTGLSATPKVGASKLAICRSGKGDRLPTGITKVGTLRLLNCPAARLGGSPVFQSPSDRRIRLRRFGWVFRASSIALCKSVPSLGSLRFEEKGWKCRSAFSLSDSQSVFPISSLMNSLLVWCSSSGVVMSAVSMLLLSSQRTATAGRCSGRNVSTHSGWFKVMAISSRIMILRMVWTPSFESEVWVCRGVLPIEPQWPSNRQTVSRFLK